MKVHNLVVTGSLTSGGENISTISSSVADTITNVSSSISASINDLSSSMEDMVTNMSSSFDTTISTLATTGSNLFVGTQTISGSIIPAVNNTYDLGSTTQQFRDLYLSSASLYIDGVKVLGSTAQELQITTDAGQSFKILETGSDTITLQSNDGNITLATSGGGDVILDPTSGVVALKGTTTIYAGNRVLSSDGNAIQFGNSVTMTGSLVVTGFIETQELRTTYISSSILYRSGSTKFGDELTDTHDFTGSLNISGSVNAIGSGLVSGSSQISYSGLSGIPSGIVSGSGQITLSSTNGFGTYIDQPIKSGSTVTFAGLTNNGTYSQSTTSTQPVMIYGDSAGINGLFRVQIDEVNDSFGTGARTYLGDGGIDIFLGTSNSSYTPGNTYIALNHGGEISMGAGSATKHFTLSTSGDATFTGTGIFAGGGNTLTLKKGTGSAALTFAGTSDQATGLIEGISGGGLRIYTSSGTLSSPSWSTKMFITHSEGVKFGANALSIIGTEGSDGYYYSYASGVPKIYIEANGVVAFLNPNGVAIGKSSASSTLDVQAAGANGIVLSADSNDTNNSGRIFLMRTGGEGWAIMNNSGNLSFRSNAVPGNTSGNERMRMDSSYNLTLNNGLSVAGATNHTSAVRMNSGSLGNSPKITFGTEDESVAGNKSIYLETYWMVIQPHVNEGLRVRFVNGSGTQTETVRFQSTQTSIYHLLNVSGNILPTSDASYNLGSTSLRWNNLYTTDLHLSNEGKQNIVDGTWGDWTLQEGEHDIFMLNNRSGEKFKIKLEKI